ncbi:hypothetical protein CEH05_03370 [Halobacillus halophilus]|uniref:Uncharacterized protein n=1 Tax=Halobacillus halophilus (strain ATCC 35676 / DSM 2266 / JCM 20832 / KCTC 3685 / LMG 17431 / NBRC 102448 / NCIMB 2269) TaxID=866895 RepID=I0JIQ2_HALH3|nr:hypothetical protein [Halobacillus halophilus]ASF38200.1 hypothetical protein CEH05_03370 [Halobacillus halophilus]CCG44020.1 hypothetical protein HBHAL_1653 [Halobacillus halophilus DSM 2266]
MKELKQQIRQWESELKKHELDLEVLQVFDNLSKYLINQKKCINELGDMLDNSQQAYVDLRRELVMEGYNLRY